MPAKHGAIVAVKNENILRRIMEYTYIVLLVSTWFGILWQFCAQCFAKHPNKHKRVSYCSHLNIILIQTPNSAYLNYGQVTLFVTKLTRRAFCAKSKLMVFSSYTKSIVHLKLTSTMSKKLIFCSIKEQTSQHFFIDIIIYWQVLEFIYFCFR